MYIITTTNIIVNNSNNTLNRSSQGHRFYKKAEGNLYLHSKVYNYLPSYCISFK